MTPAEKATRSSRENKWPTNVPRKSREFVEASAAYRQREFEIRNEFAGDLALDCGLATYPVAAKKAFDYAWSEGHSGGYQCVQAIYEEIADIVNDVLDAYL